MENHRGLFGQEKHSTQDFLRLLIIALVLEPINHFLDISKVRILLVVRSKLAVISIHDAEQILRTCW